MEHKNTIQEVLIAWKISSIVFGNVVALIMAFTWWQGESWVRADNGAIVEMSQAMRDAQRRR